jgi:hypothetical protein
MKRFYLLLLLCSFYSFGEQTYTDKPLVLPTIVGEYYPYADPLENTRFEKECFNRFGIDITE